MLHGGAGYLKDKLVGPQGTGAPGVPPSLPSPSPHLCNSDIVLQSRAAWHCQAHHLGAAVTRLYLFDPNIAALLGF